MNSNAYLTIHILWFYHKHRIKLRGYYGQRNRQ